MLSPILSLLLILLSLDLFFPHVFIISDSQSAVKFLNSVKLECSSAVHSARPSPAAAPVSSCGPPPVQTLSDMMPLTPQPEERVTDMILLACLKVCHVVPG